MTAMNPATAAYITEWGDTYTLAARTGKYDETNPNDDVSRIIEARDEDGNLASHMYLDLTTGQIMQVETREENRREGIATALARYAVDNGIPIFHSPEEHCTREGAMFAAMTDFIDEIDPALAYRP